MKLSEESIKIINKKWRKKRNNRGYKQALLNFHRKPSEENACIVCKFFPKSINNIKDPTPAVETYNKLYWS
jgi:hypothetical protein